MKRPTNRAQTRKRFALTCAAACAFGTFAAIEPSTSPAQWGGAPLGGTSSNRFGDAVNRGLNETVRGTLQGQRTGDALQRGVNETFQSATETLGQTQFRDQQRRVAVGVFLWPAAAT